MMPAEYAVCLATFATIQAWGVEEGMAAGLVLAALSFIIAYAQASQGGGGVLIDMHGRSLETVDPRIPTMPGRSTNDASRMSAVGAPFRGQTTVVGRHGLGPGDQEEQRTQRASWVVVGCTRCRPCSFVACCLLLRGVAACCLQ